MRIPVLLLPFIGLAVAGFAQIKAQVYVSGLSAPILMLQDPTNANVQFVCQQRGRIRTISNGVLQTSDFMTLVGTVSSSGVEQGLLGMAFHPNYATNRYFFVNFTDIATGATKIVRYTRNVANPLLGDPASAYTILTISQPYNNHNGGTLRFGPDGYLYIGTGDGGNGYDPGNRAQDITGQLLGKMLRIDVNSDAFPADATRNYAIPSSNPFANITGDDEIWAFGLRNPWKFSFDDPTKLGSGGMIIADVGQDAWEEVDYEPALASGRNYGWRAREGYVDTGLSGGVPPYKDPIFTYDHSIGLAITGGYIYRGTKLGDFFGQYFFGDYQTGRFFSLPMTYTGLEANNNIAVELTNVLGTTLGRISSIDVDSLGEPYVVGYTGSIFKLLPDKLVWPVDLAPLATSTITGSVRSLLANDDKILTMRPLTAFDGLEENLSILVIGNLTDDLTSPFINVSVRARHNAFGPGVMKIAVKNWTTGSFVYVGTFAPTETEQVFNVNNLAAGTYRRADGRIEVNLRTYYLNAPPNDPFLVYIDQLKITTHL